MNKRVLSLIIAVLMLATLLSGCGSNVVSSEALSLKLVSPLSKQEVLEYYANAMEYNTVITRKVNPHINTYETKTVTDTDELSNIKTAIRTTEYLLSRDDYKQSDKYSRFMNTSIYNYIRAMLNDKALTNGNVVEVKKALGYYFVDVEYDIIPSVIGEFNNTISLVGMHGSFHYYENENQDKVYMPYILSSIKKLNDYYESNSINLEARYDDENGFVIGEPLEEEEESTPNYAETTLGNGENTGEYESTGTNENNETPEPTPTPAPSNDTEEPELTTDGITYNVNRAPRIDLTFFNKVAGYSTTTAYIPELSMIYTIDEELLTHPDLLTFLDDSDEFKDASDEDKENARNALIEGDRTIYGIGLYPCGGLGMAKFGMNRQNLSGTCKLRYCYKQDILDENILYLDNIYVMNYDIDNGPSKIERNNIPTFLEDDFKQLIERADRVMNNNDINGMMAGNVFNDVGMAVLNGYTRNYGNVIRQISELDRIISRKMDSNSYLVEINTTVTEGPKSVDRYAQYNDKVYVVIEQINTEFVITDWMIMSRELITEPDIDPYAATVKRIVALGLTGVISDEAKQNANALIQELYNASTYRVLNGPWTTSDGTVTIDRGMIDLFNSNPEMLSPTKKDAINEKLRGLLVYYGVNTGAKMSGHVTEWIGSSSTGNQIEFITEELIEYQGRSEGKRLQVYYLVSNIEDTWVIDDLQIIGDIEDIQGSRLESLKAEIG